jgi:23S rRNA (uracil1939-C5)-methyltransferase
VNEQAEVVIEKLVHGGSGLARLGTGQAIFVPRVLPGERVIVSIRRKRKGVLEAELVKVITPSPDRIAPPCDGEKQCTGATWPHIAYPAQLRYKLEILLDTLRRIGGIDTAYERSSLCGSRTADSKSVFFARARTNSSRWKMRFSFTRSSTRP